MGGNERYVKVRPNPDALTHVEIFDRLVGHGGGGIAGGPDGPTGPFLIEGRRLELVLDELATMVSQLSTSYEAESIRLATSTIDAMRGHMTALGEHATHLAHEFDGYVEQFHQVRSRMPEPAPFAAQLDAIDEHYPGLLAQLPFVAELQEEHEARTREARELYRRLDQAAVATDDATPEFPLLADATTTNGAEAALTASTVAAAPWPSGDASGSRGTSVAPTSPAGNVPPPVASTAPPVISVPAPTPGAGSSHPITTPVPTGPRAPGVGGAESRPGLPLPPPGQGASGGQRVRGSGAGAGAPGRAGGMPGDTRNRHDVISRGRVTDLGREGGRAGGGVSAPAEQQAASRTAPARGGINGAGLGPVGPMNAATREEDRERKRPSYLEADDPNALFGTDQRVAPPVIGAFAPRTDH